MQEECLLLLIGRAPDMVTIVKETAVLLCWLASSQSLQTLDQKALQRNLLGTKASQTLQMALPGTKDSLASCCNMGAGSPLKGERVRKET